MMHQPLCAPACSLTDISPFAVPDAKCCTIFCCFLQMHFVGLLDSCVIAQELDMPSSSMSVSAALLSTVYQNSILPGEKNKEAPCSYNLCRQCYPMCAVLFSVLH